MRELILINSDELPDKHVYGRDIDSNKYRHQLGTNQEDVYWDASNGLHPNAFAAIAGSITDGHHLYLHLPLNYANGDPDHLRMLDYGRPIALTKANFNQRLRRLLNQAPINEISHNDEHDDQHDDIHATVLTITPQVIVGKRGRGKSTWLAKKINWLHQHHHHHSQQYPTILLVTTFSAHRERIMGLVSNHINMQILPPDEACRLLPTADYLIVDEAAAIPSQQLLTLTEHYPYFSLASSEDGYEGSGRFFSLQTLPTLQQQHPLLRVITLRDGQRFAAQDKLEARIEQIFFPQSCSKPLQGNLHTMSLSIREISRHALARNELLLGQIYQLLFQGHYKTQPADLKRLLDIPDQHLFVAFYGTTPVAVLHVLVEHPLVDELAQAVMANKRRPQGRLLMQQLLLHTQMINYAHQPIARIQRIVTHPSYRRQGIASLLIGHAVNVLPYPFGVSYGEAPELTAFWSSQGFDTVYRSQTRHARHARYNVIQLRRD